MSYDNSEETNTKTSAKKTTKTEHNNGEAKTHKKYEVFMDTSPSKQVSYH